MDRDEEIELEHETNLVADLEQTLAETTSLCRFEELAKLKIRLRAAEARAIKPPK